MLYVIHGTDRQKARRKLMELVEVLQKKRPDAPVLRVDKESWSAGLFGEVIASAGLFSPKNIVILDSLVENSESSENIMDHLDALAESEHVCVLIEEKIKAADLKKIEKLAEKVQEFNIVSAPENKKAFPETFAFAEAVAAKEKVRAWSILQRLTEDSLAAEEIHGVLWWQFKSIALAASAKNAKEAGLNPFVYSKCQNLIKKWDGSGERGEESLDGALLKIVEMYHLAHRGEIDFMSELEKLSLS